MANITQGFVARQMEMSLYIGKRKHCSQMNDFEMKSIMDKLENIERWNIRTHALDRIEEKGINATYNDLVSMIDNSSILEYKIDYNQKMNRCEERVLLRANSVVNVKYNLNVVYSITQRAIITVWINEIDDKHETLDWSIYDENMMVF